MDEIEFDELKTKVLKYAIYKKRSEAEIRRKFAEYYGETLDSIIEILKENNYIDDDLYIERTVSEYERLKDMSIRELEYKLLSKGIEKRKIADYIFVNKERLLEYELKSARNVYNKKIELTEKDNVLNFLRSKGYMPEIIQVLQEEE